MTELLDNQVKIGAWTWTVWPTWPLPTLEWIVATGAEKGPAEVDKIYRQREEFIIKEKHDPLIYGWEQPPLKVLRALLAGTYVPGCMQTATGPAGVSLVGPDWKQEKPANDIAMLGGNGSAKTDVQAKLAMEVLTSKPNREVRCFSQNEATSIRYIQKAMFRYLPPKLRHLKRLGQTTKISYSEATGFSLGVFVLSTHSTGLFPTYKGWEQDKKSVEGGECHALTWDEEIPADLVETVRFRAHKTGGFVLGGFTPVAGYTETVGQYIEGATIIECIPARDVVWNWWARNFTWGEWLLPKDEVLVKGCPPGHVPFVVQSGKGAGRRFAVVFPTPFNPYTNVREIIAGVQGSPKEFALERLWGWATNRVRKAHPDFGDVHIVKPERLPHRSELTVYLWADPHGNRNWFMAWLGVDADNNVWVLKEWPDRTMGEWALPGKNDGKVGPAQTTDCGKTFNDYKRLILEAEGWKLSAEGAWERGPDAWRIADRWLDPRPAGTSIPSDEEALNYLDHLNNPIMRESAEGRMVEFAGFGDEATGTVNFVAGPACGIEEGKQLVNNWINDGWDRHAPATPMNRPKFYVNAECENIIWALRTYTGADGDKGACKDPIDVLKGPAKLAIRHVAPGMLGSAGGGGGY